jgi:hypothetical protein
MGCTYKKTPCLLYELYMNNIRYEMASYFLSFTKIDTPIFSYYAKLR